jgi:hypothetical protein
MKRTVILPLAPVMLSLVLLTLSSDGLSQSTTHSKQLSFAKSDQVFEPAWTRHILLRDLDGDRDLDAVFANCTGYHSQIWLNDGQGTFSMTGQLLSKAAHGIDAGDLDGDEDIDLFITCHYFMENGEPRHLRSKVHLNDGKAGFVDNGQQIEDSLFSGNVVKLDDIDSDGDLDALVIYHKEPSKVFLNDGKGQFALSNFTFPDVGDFGDLNGDGILDILTRTRSAGFEFWSGNGDGTFTKEWEKPDSALQFGLSHFCDLDHDNDLDAVLTDFSLSEELPTRVWINDGSGQFSEGASLPGVFRGTISFGDLNNDGYSDAVATNHDAEAQIWLNDGSGTLVDSGILLGAASDKHESAAIGDIDGDGDLDILLAEGRGGRNTIWFNMLQ